MRIFKGGALLHTDKYIKDYTKIIDGKFYTGVIPSKQPKGYFQYPYALVHKLGVDTFDQTPEIRYIQDAKVKSTIKLKEYQENIILPFLNLPYGILYSAPGTGKTIIGAELIARTNLSTVILVNSKFLLNQWHGVILDTLNYKSGKIGGGNFDVKDITVATFQTARKRATSLFNSHSLVIVDECHHIAAETFKNTLSSIPAYWKVGLTGTYKRKDELEFMANWFLGDRLIENLVDDTMRPEIIIVRTKIKIGGGSFVESLTDIAINSDLLEVITTYVNKCAKESRHQLIIPFRLSTVNLLSEIYPEAIVVIGETDEETRSNLNEKIKENRLIISTTLQEGANIPNLDTLHLIHPNNNLPMLEQRIKRICRTVEGKKTPLVFDYFFTNNSNADYSVYNQQQIRLKFYQQKGYKIYVV